MNTRFIGIKEFRKSISSFAKEAQKKKGKERIIVMNHSQPLFEIVPFPKKYTLSDLHNEIIGARQEIKDGNTYTAKEVREMLQ